MAEMLPSAQTAPLIPKPRNYWPIIIGVCIASVVLIGAGTFFYFNSSKKAKEIPNNHLFKSPINLKNPKLRSYGMFYYFDTYIKQVIPKADGAFELITDLEGPANPPIMVNGSTRVSFGKIDNLTLADSRIIKPDQNAVISISYNDATKKWDTRIVNIITDENLNSTTSANPI